MSKVVLSGYIVVPDAILDQVTEALKIHCKLTLEEPGCLQFSVVQNQQSLNRFDVYEEFVDQAAFDAHQSRVKASDWGRLTLGVERFYQIETS